MGGCLVWVRVGHVDVAKGLSILLVALGHSGLLSGFYGLNGALALVRLPLFFFLAGVFFKRQEDVPDFLARRGDSLLKPYLVASLLFLWLDYYEGKDPRFADFLGIFWGTQGSVVETPFWFLPHLFALLLVCAVMFRRVGERWLSGWRLAGIIAVLFVTGAFGMESLKGFKGPSAVSGLEVLQLPFSLELVPWSLSLFLAGYGLRGWVKELEVRWWMVPLGLAAVWLGHYQLHGYVNLDGRAFGPLLPSALASAGGILAALGLSVYCLRVGWLRRFLEWCGRGSLVLLIFHSPVFGHLDWWGMPKVPAFVLSIVLSLGIFELIRRVKVLRWGFLPLRVPRNRSFPSARRAAPELRD